MLDAAPTGMNQDRSQGDLARLLLRLDPDPAGAWERYASIRRRLAKFFEWNRCAEPEGLADEVLDRVAAKPEGEEIREVEKYSLAVARFVCLEEKRRRQHEVYSEDLPGGTDVLPCRVNQSEEIVNRIDEEKRLDCLRKCLARLNSSDRELVIRYYSAEEQKQMIFRRELAHRAGLTLGALRVRMNRTRAQLEPCVTSCVEFGRQTLSRAS
jgi:DNA-directed RNA polymerase specialized sigma24 family protein